MDITLAKREAVLSLNWKENETINRQVKNYLQERFPIRVLLKHAILYYEGLGKGPWDVIRYREIMKSFVDGLKYGS
jgi:hypothetical protein